VPPILEKRERWCRVYENSSTVMFDIKPICPSSAAIFMKYFGGWSEPAVHVGDYSIL